MDPKKLFPDVPQDLTPLSSEDLEALATSIRERIMEVKEGRSDPEIVGELTTTEVLAQAQAAVAEFERVNDTIAARVLETTEYDNAFEGIVEKVAPKEEVVAEGDGGEGDGGEGDGAVVEEPEVVAEVETPAEEPVVEVATPEIETPAEEPVVAEVQEPAMVAAARLPRPKADRVPIEVVEGPKGTALIASAGIQGITPGKPLERFELADAMIKTIRGGSVRSGEEKVVVASANWGEQFPEGLRLMPHDGWQRTMEKIEAAYGEEAITASGGLCAPRTPYYELMNVAVADRPVRDALANFNAVRGGLQFAAPPTIASITTGVGTKTVANDALGGTFATKTCQVVSCPAFSTVDIQAIYHCLQFGNFNARAFPEMIATYNDLVMAAHARLAEQALLDGISATATHVTDAASYGAASTFISGVLQAAAGIRNRLRMNPRTRLRVLAPAWIADAFANDIVETAFGRFEVTPDSVTALLERYNVNMTWYYDTNTGGGQLFPAEVADTTLDNFPTTALWYIFPEGSYLFLDGGTLDLGIVRDSVLNATNDFQIFGETFENVAFVGPAALRVASAICANGTVAPAGTAITCP